ncbi:MAG TPA: GFA family protein [Bauldia sp.]|nr:GFA family protein [Bauldia sp.]
MPDVRITGGCQCGAVRYAMHTPPTDCLICYCRMCQKQFGNIFGAFAAVERKDFEITRGKLGRWKSSDIGVRTFCADCGTPMGWDSLDPSRTNTWVSLGSLDNVEAVRPLAQWGGEARPSWVDEVIAMPVGITGGGDAAGYRDADRIHPRTHPDHDTEYWPPK